MFTGHLIARMVQRGVWERLSDLLHHLLSEHSKYYKSLRPGNNGIYVRYNNAFYVVSANDGNIVTVMKPKDVMKFLMAKQLKLMSDTEIDNIQFKMVGSFLEENDRQG